LSVKNPFKWRHFQGTVISYQLSYRDVEELMADRGLHVDHTTIFRWVQRFAMKLKKKVRRMLRQTNDSYRVDETYLIGGDCGGRLGTYRLLNNKGNWGY